MGLLGGVGDFAVSLLSAGLNFLGAKETNQTSEKLSQRQMDFQERMSSTAYQRAVKDMQLAGLNPMLAYSQGGASAPVGSMPQVQNALASATSGAASAAATLQSLEQIKKTQADTELTLAQAEQTRRQTLDASVYSARADAEVKEIQERGARIGFEKLSEEEKVRLLRWQLKDVQQDYNAKAAVNWWSERAKGENAEALGSIYSLAKSKAEHDFYRTVGPGAKYWDMVMDAIGGGSSAKRAFDPVRARRR